ncbi:MAG TPA: hypothetical protein VNY82_03610 [Steroidobacteraceae bacterium]|nr:hypothetical protein [Steroidobacteraceae bacterium]
MRGRSPPSAVALLVAAVALQILSACSSPPPKRESASHAPPRISPEFVGTWTNINPGFQNWWVITPDKVVNYGVSLETGKCHSSEATILAANQIDIPFGNTAQPFLYIVKGRLLFDVGGQRGIHVRVSPAAICKGGKSYFEGAPYPSR